MNEQQDLMNSEIATWVSSPCNGVVRYGHLKTRKSYGTSWRYQFGIVAAISDPKMVVVFVGSDYELAMNDCEHPERSENPRFYPQTYSSISSLLEKNRVADQKGAGPGCWKLADDVNLVKSDDILPNRVLFVLVLDPYRSAACCVAMALISRWTTDIRQLQDASISILTMSDGDPSWAMGEMLRIHSGSLFRPEPRIFLSPSVDENKNEQQNWDHVLVRNDDELVDAVRHKIDGLLKENPEQYHVIIWYHPIATALDEMGRPWEISRISEAFDARSFFTPLRKAQCQVQVQIFSGHAGSVPVTDLPGFHHVHVVPGTHDASKFSSRPWHVKAKQQGYHRPASYMTLTERMRALSRDERQEQLQWGSWASCDSHNVHVYTAERGVESFLASADGNRPSFVHEAQMTGFIAVLSTYADWDVMVGSTMQTIIAKHDLLEVFAGRLCWQKVISIDHEGGRQRISSGLPEPNRSMLRAILPILHNDFDLAYFLCLPSQSLMVMSAKCQIAVFAAMETRRRAIILTNQLCIDDAVDACWGLEKSLASTSTLWLRLGLFKRAWREYDGFIIPNSAWVNGTPQLLGGQVEIDVQAHQDTSKAIMHAINVVRSFGINASLMHIDNETDLHSPADCATLQSHMLQAFLYRLTLVVPSPGDPTPNVYDVTTTSRLVSATSDAQHAIAAALQQRGGKVRYGVYTDAEVMDDMGDQRLLRGWTWIPSDIVEAWRAKHCAPSQRLDHVLQNPHCRV